MNLINRQICVTVFFILFFSNIFSLKSQILGTTSSKSKSSENPNLDYIKVCKWKNATRTCVVFSFDDNCRKHKQISKIFDRYGFKATFFVNSSNMLVDSVKAISAAGHEIGNHTYSHPKLLDMDSTQIDFQIGKGKEMIESVCGVKCVSFAEPFHQRSSLISRTAYRYHLFIRDYPLYPINKRTVLVSTPTSMASFQDCLKSSISSGEKLEIAGHSIDGEDYKPITKDSLIQILDYVKDYVNSGDVWVTTTKESGLYENLFHEIIIERKFSNDTLTIKFKNFNRENYKILNSSPISIEIPSIFANSISVKNDSVDVIKLKDKYVVTVDLMRDTCLVIKLNTTLDDDKVNYLYPNAESPFFLYPNPTSDYIKLRFKGDLLSGAIYNTEGFIQKILTEDNSKIDVSELKKGCYLIKVSEKYNNDIINYNTVFFKK